MGGLHHGYLLPHEGANNIGYAFFFSVVGRLRNIEQNSEHTKMFEAFKYANDTNASSVTNEIF
jgi:hypothetical protein